MKYSLIVSIFVLSLIASPVLANEAHHPSDSATEQSGSSATVQPSGGMGMMQMHGDMQQHMDKMHAMMEKARHAKDASEKRSLMHEHKQEMHKAMAKMQGMMGGKGSNMSAMPMEKRMENMEAGMGMMKKMMQHMMDQQSMMMDMKSDMEGR
jgi:hypothetical protein